MKFSTPILFIKQTYIYFLVSAIYILYSFAFLKPWTITNFSLVDDGQVLMQNASYFESCIHSYECSNFVAQTLEWGTGRIRPTYWLIQDFIYEIFKNNAMSHHIFRVFGVGLIAVFLMTYVLNKMKLGAISIVLATTLLFTSFSFSENIVRLGPNEPFQVIFLLIFSLFYLSSDSIEKNSLVKNIVFVLLLVAGLFIKESGISLLFAIFCTETIINRKIGFKSILVTGIPIALFAAYLVSDKLFPFVLNKSIPVYTSNYLTNPFTILNNASLIVEILLNTLSPFLKISILMLPIFILSNRFRSKLFDKKFVYWSTFSFFFVSIMFPWRYVLDRYQLVGIMGLSIFISLIFSNVLDFTRNIISKKINNSYAIPLFNIIVSFIIINLFSHGFSLNLSKTINYRSWYSQFTQFESDQVKALLKYNNKNIYVNGKDTISNWEFNYEIPIHFRYLYNTESTVKLLSNKPTSGSYVFSRTSFDSYIKIDDIAKVKSTILDSKSYSVPQIDPLAFRQNFVMKPVTTIINPPLQKEDYNYYWEVRKIN